MKIIMLCERFTKNIFISLLYNTSGMLSRKGLHTVYIIYIYIYILILFMFYLLLYKISLFQVINSTERTLDLM
jgi:hypothetical protein